jgi:SAM-dependent methyltransferase
MSVYIEPLYYEIAFSFVDAVRQVDLFEEFIERYSPIRVRRFLDIGCGPALQLREIAGRGYDALGLDMNSQMLDYLRERAVAEGLRIETVLADMADFNLEEPVDFAFIMMGTIGLIESKERFLSHLDCVADSLRKGGLYLLENLRLNWAGEGFFGPQSWTMERDGIMVKTTYDIRLKDALAQMLTETMRLEVDDNGRELVLEESRETRMIFPQEFITLVEMNGRFEFLGWFERGRIVELKKASMDNIALLRHK